MSRMFSCTSSPWWLTIAACRLLVPACKLHWTMPLPGKPLLVQQGRTQHVEDVLLHALALVISARPVVARPAAVPREEDVLRVEQVLDVRVLDGVDHPALARSLNPLVS